MPTIGRILDANANRAREALRVMEEAARFVLEDADLAGDLKRARHEVTALLERLAEPISCRDIDGDVGTGTSTPRERTRSSLREVVIAAGKRLGESLRALEEYGKISDPALAVSFESLRYACYELERRLVTALGAGRAPQWRLCVLITESLCRLPWSEVAEAACDAGADALQLREKTLDDRELLRRARRLVELAGDVAVIINDRPDIALLSGADGVHLGQGDLRCGAVRRLVEGRLLIGVSTASIDQAREARDDGADYCGVGCMYATRTKTKPVAGPAYLSTYLAWGALPHLAVGGIDADRARELAALGCRGVAVSSAVCGADDPGAVVGAIRRALELEERVTASR